MNRDRQSRLPVVLIAVLGALLAGGVAARLLMDDGPGPKAAHAQGKHVHGKGEGKQLYTCGMHPNVIQEGPSSCPICGMDLTPMKKASGGKKKGERKIKHWRAPMDPNYIRDEPGKSPMGMDLVPVYEDGEGGDAEGTVIVDPVMVQNMGVRVDHVKEGSLSRRVRTIGEVVVAEDLVSVVNLKYSGWIERLFVDQTGVKVRKGQALFSVYSPELVSAQEEYLLAIRTRGGKESPWLDLPGLASHSGILAPARSGASSSGARHCER